MFEVDEGARAGLQFIALLALALVILLAIAFCSAPASAEVASWYGHKHNGRLTASGERFNMHRMTAAHKTLPFGTRLKVCLRGCVVVKINDRGPFIRGRDLDLSYGAARAIGLSGVGRVSVQRVP